ncbi:hypothetical protein KM043_002773 [Ampulex compressa]|nr:hypothetical protein KM043_002773 [Ampulex compressa]
MVEARPCTAVRCKEDDFTYQPYYLDASATFCSANHGALIGSSLVGRSTALLKLAAPYGWQYFCREAGHLKARWKEIKTNRLCRGFQGEVELFGRGVDRDVEGLFLIFVRFSSGEDRREGGGRARSRESAGTLRRRGKYANPGLETEGENAG